MFNSSFATMKRNMASGQGIMYSIFSGGKLNQGDVAAINNYANAMKGGATSAQAWQNNMGGCSVAAKRYVLDARKAGKSTDEMVDGLNEVPKVTTAASVGLKALSVAGNMLISMGVSMAINLIIKGFQALANAQENAIEKANEFIGKFEEQRNTLNSNKETIDSISKDYETLAQGVDSLGRNISLSSDEYARYNEIVNQIADMFPKMIQGYTKEGNAIISHKGSVEELTKAYEEQKKAAQDAIIAGSADVFEGYKAKVDKDRFWRWEESGLLQKKDIAEKVIKEGGYLPSDVDSVGLSTWSEIINEVFSGDLTKYKPEERVTKLRAYLSTVIAELNAETAKIKPIMQAYLEQSFEFQGLDEKSQDIVRQIVGQFDSEFYAQFDNETEMAAWVTENIVNKFKGKDGKKMESEFQMMLGIQTQFNKGEITVSEYQEKLATFLKTIEPLPDETEKYIKLLFGIKTDDDGNTSSDVDTMIANVKKKFNGKFEKEIGQLTLDDLKVLSNLDISPKGVESWAEVVTLIANAKKQVEQTTTSLKSLNNAKGALDKLFDAYEQDMALTVGEVSSLLEENPEYIKYLIKVGDKYKVNKQALEDWKTIQEEQQRLIDDKMGSNQYADEYNPLLSRVSKDTSSTKSNGDGNWEGGKEALDGLIAKNKELNQSFADGKISATDYFKSLSDSITDSGLEKALDDLGGKFDDTTDYIESTISVLANELSDAMVQASKRYELGKTSVGDYIDELDGGLDAQMKLLKSTYDLEAGEDGLVEVTDDMNEATKKAAESFNEAFELQDDIDAVNKFADAMESYNDSLMKYVSDDNMTLTDAILGDPQLLNTHMNTVTDFLVDFSQASTENFNTVSQQVQSALGISQQAAEDMIKQGGDAIQAAVGQNMDAINGLSQGAMQNAQNTITNASQAIGGVLTALGNAISNFDYTLKFEPYGEFGIKDLINVEDGKVRINSPGTFGIKISGSGGSSVVDLSSALTEAGNYFSSQSGGGAGGYSGYSSTPSTTAAGKRPGSSSGSGGGGGGSKDNSKDDTKNEALENHLKNAEQSLKTHKDELKYIDDLQYAYDNLTKTEEEREDILKRIAQAREDYVKDEIEAIDNIQSAYNTLQTAMEEQSEFGALSVDTLQSLLELEPQYINMLIDENGNLALNEEAINNCTAAYLDQLGAKSALNLIDSVQHLKTEQEQLELLTGAALESGEAMWELVYAQLAIVTASTSGAVSEALTRQVEAIKNMTESAKAGLGKGGLNGFEKEKSEKAKEDEAFKASLDARRDVLERHAEYIESLDFGLELVDERDFDNKTELLTRKLSEITKYGIVLKKEFDNAAKAIPKTSEEADSLASHLSYLGDEIRENITDLREVRGEIEKLKIDSIATRSQDYLDEMTSELDNIQRRIEILQSDNKDDFKFTNQMLQLDIMLPSQTDINKNLRNKSAEDKKLIKQEQETQNKLNDILKTQIQKNEKLRDEERNNILKMMQELQKDTEKKLEEVHAQYVGFLETNETDTKDSCDNIATTIDSTDVEFPEPTIDMTKVDTAVDNTIGKFEAFEGVVGRLNSKADELAGTLSKIAGITGKSSGGSKVGNGHEGGVDGGDDRKNNVGGGDPLSATFGSIEKAVDEYIKKKSPDLLHGDVSGLGYGDPVRAGFGISSNYGYRIHPIYGYRKFHAGMDINAPYGEKLYSVADGIVTLSGYNGGYGNCIIIRDNRGVEWLYGHMAYPSHLSVGQAVVRGQNVGLVGSTGLSTGPHLHIEARVNGQTRNPADFLPNYAVGTPRGNAIARNLGIAGENYRPEILIDKASGRMEIIDTPTLINTLETDVVGEKATATLPKYEEGTVKVAKLAYKTPKKQQEDKISIDVQTSEEDEITKVETEILLDLAGINSKMSEVESFYEDAFTKYFSALAVSHSKPGIEDDPENGITDDRRAYEEFDIARSFKNDTLTQVEDVEKYLIEQFDKYIKSGGNDREIIEAYHEAINNLSDISYEIESSVADARTKIVSGFDKSLEEIDYFISEMDFYKSWGSSGTNKLEKINEKRKSTIQAFEEEKFYEEEFIKRMDAIAREEYTATEELISNISSSIEELITKKEAQISKRKESLNFYSEQLNSKQTVTQAYFDVANAVRDAFNDIDKSLKASKAMVEYLNEDTRELLFNQKDYNILSSELNDILKKSNALKREYTYKIETASKENLAEITSEYQMQNGLLMKRYEIAKAELEVAKKRTQLDNVLNERNVRMFINGAWQWVANTQDVINAQNELADAANAQAQADDSLSQTKVINAFTEERNKLATEVNLLDKELADFREKWKDIQDGMKLKGQSLNSMLKTMVESNLPRLQDVMNRFGDGLAELLDGITGETPSALIKQIEATGGVDGSSAQTAPPEGNTLAYIPTVGEKLIHSDSDGNITTKGLPEGTVVHTDDGDYKIVSKWTDGAKHNPYSGYWSIKLDEKNADGTRYTSGGVTLMGEDGEEIYIPSDGRFIPITQPTIGNIPSGGIVFNSEQMKNLRTMWDMSNLSLAGNTSFISGAQPQTIDNSNCNNVIINGMTVDSGSADGQALISALRRYVGNH